MNLLRRKKKPNTSKARAGFEVMSGGAVIRGYIKNEMGKTIWTDVQRYVEEGESYELDMRITLTLEDA